MVAAPSSLSLGGRFGRGLDAAATPPRRMRMKLGRPSYPVVVSCRAQGRGHEESASEGQRGQAEKRGQALGVDARGPVPPNPGGIKAKAAAEEGDDSVSSRLSGVQQKLASLEKEMENIEEEFKQFERNSY
mmetsp:Transcript_9799/g.24449  ORF Transcript_9799/g.24449 Transcript_9799/m.24449 type:complete len:131 (+) Transcript_9799:89-481(+)